MCNLEYCTVISQCGSIRSANKKCAWCISIFNNSPAARIMDQLPPIPGFIEDSYTFLCIARIPTSYQCMGILTFLVLQPLLCYKWLRYAVQSQLFSIRHTFKIVKEQCLYTYSQPLLTEYRASYITIWDGIVFTKDGIATLVSSKLDRVGIMD